MLGNSSAVPVRGDSEIFCPSQEEGKEDALHPQWGDPSRKTKRGKTVAILQARATASPEGEG